jgi:hypothetical protein
MRRQSHLISSGHQDFLQKSKIVNSIFGEEGQWTFGGKEVEKIVGQQNEREPKQDAGSESKDRMG